MLLLPEPLTFFIIGFCQIGPFFYGSIAFITLTYDPYIYKSCIDEQTPPNSRHTEIPCFGKCSQHQHLRRSQIFYIFGQRSEIGELQDFPALHQWHWKIVDRQAGQERPLTLRWVWTIQHDGIHQTRLVCRGFNKMEESLEWATSAHTRWSQSLCCPK